MIKIEVSENGHLYFLFSAIYSALAVAAGDADASGEAVAVSSMIPAAAEAAGLGFSEALAAGADGLGDIMSFASSIALQPTKPPATTIKVSTPYNSLLFMFTSSSFSKINCTDRFFMQ